LARVRFWNPGPLLEKGEDRPLGGDRDRVVTRESYLVLLLLILACATASSEPTEPTEPTETTETTMRMLRVVFRDISPGVDAASFAGQPRTLYRVGQRYGRMEHPLDPEVGVHALVIVNEPHMWVINRASGVGRYSVDPGPSYVFRAPVLLSRRRPVDITNPLRSLEFGREFEFLRAHGVTPIETQGAEGTKVDRYEVALDDFTLIVIASPGGEVPSELRILKGDDLHRAYRYDEYQRDLTADISLFLPPKGVRILGRPR
jgi:hypothetical protein